MLAFFCPFNVCLQFTTDLRLCDVELMYVEDGKGCYNKLSVIMLVATATRLIVIKIITYNKNKTIPNGRMTI